MVIKRLLTPGSIPELPSVVVLLGKILYACFHWGQAAYPAEPPREILSEVTKTDITGN